MEEEKEKNTQENSREKGQEKDSNQKDVKSADEKKNTKDNGLEEEDKIMARKIAMYYTRKDKELTDLMLQGVYNDLYAIKFKFTSTSIYGAVLLFLNRKYNSLVDSYSIVSPSFTVDEIYLNVEWDDYEKDIRNHMDKDIHDNKQIFHLLDIIKNKMSSERVKNIVYYADMNDQERLEKLVTKEILDTLNLENLKCEVGINELSSLDMELNSKISLKLTEDQLEGKEKEKKEDAKEEEIDFEIEEDKDTIKPEDIKLIFNGELILKPLGGIHIEGLVVHDEVRIRLLDKTPKAVMIAKAFNAFQDGRMKPIQGKIVSFRKKKKTGGFKIFVEIAEGIFVRIDEDEKDIKVDFVAPSPDRSPDLQKDIAKHVNKFIDKRKTDEKKKRELENRVKNLENRLPNDVYIPLLTGIVIMAIIIIIIFFLI